jgi:hypothetical protein
MQNKANFKMGNINISTARTNAYAKEQRTMNNERYQKQSQIKANFKRKNTLLRLPDERLPRPWGPRNDYFE